MPLDIQMDMSGGPLHIQVCGLKGRTGLEIRLLDMLVSRVIFFKVLLNEITIVTLSLQGTCAVQNLTVNPRPQQKQMVGSSIFINYNQNII